jgi:GAF domain-containing protein
MLARHHRLKIGQVGIVGYVAASGVSRVALDTGIDPTYFNNPLLPDTHSEIALPLKVNNNIIGVLDVQSREPNAFTQDDISILQIMSDQLALAIQRVILATEQEESLREIESAYQSFTLSSWKSFSRGVELKKGYSFDGMNISPIENLPLEYQDSLVNGKSIVTNNLDNKDISESTLAVPLKLRDRVIGALTIEFNSNTIPRETISLAEEIAGRLAIALENARLYTETQVAAERERAISQASANIGKAVDIDSILRYMVEELGGKLKDVDVAVQIGRNDQHSEA